MGLPLFMSFSEPGRDELVPPRSLSLFVAAREFLVPFPRALDDGGERLELRRPAELSPNFFGGSDQSRWITGSPRFFGNGNFFACHDADGVDHLAHAGTTTRPKI